MDRLIKDVSTFTSRSQATTLALTEFLGKWARTLSTREVLDRVKRLSSGDHAVLFYESLEDKHRVLFAFLKTDSKKGNTPCTSAGSIPLIRFGKE